MVVSPYAYASIDVGPYMESQVNPSLFKSNFIKYTTLNVTSFIPEEIL